ncbi:cytochrome P450 20A1 isoform X3 [Eretmochelys imbricata]
MLDFAIFAVTFLLILVGAVLYLCPASRQASGIPGMTPTDEKDGNLPDIVTSGSLHEFLVNLHEKYGPVVSFWFGRRLVVSVGSIDLLKQHINPNRTSDPFEMMLKSLLRYQSGLSGDAGESHLRKKLYENGVTKSLQSNFAVIQKLSEELLAKWLSFPESQHVPLCQHMLGFAMKSVTQTAMGGSFEDDREVIRFRRNHDAIWAEIGKGFLDGSLDKSMTRKKLYEDALMEMESVLKKVTKERRGRSFNRHVFIDSLLQGNLSDKQILEDTMIFSLAGCVITANRIAGRSCVRRCGQQSLRQLPHGCRSWREELTSILFPKRFDPDRFSDESAMKNFSLLGFSGSQECPELRFAYMVATVLLSMLVRKLYLHPVKGQVMETKYELVTSPKEEAWITVSKRS